MGLGEQGVNERPDLVRCPYVTRCIYVTSRMVNRVLTRGPYRHVAHMSHVAALPQASLNRVRYGQIWRHGLPITNSVQ